MLESWALLVNPPPRPIPSPSEPATETRALVQDIISRFHEVHRRDFPEAIRLARQVERECPLGLEGASVADHLAMMFDELEAHQQREERVLFPAMLNGGCAAIQVPVRRMMADHDDVEIQLAALKDMLGGYVAPGHAPTRWILLVAYCRKIDQDLREHMRIENEELFAPHLAPVGDGRPA
jgi:regulator of cell morphogenesis and NO signaling